MRIIARRTLREFVDSLKGSKDQDAVKTALDAWYYATRAVRWPNAAAIKQMFATASIVSAERIVFNIKGNAYRLVVAVDFGSGTVWIKWIGSHADYDRIDVRRVEYGE